MYGLLSSSLRKPLAASIDGTPKRKVLVVSSLVAFASAYKDFRWSHAKGHVPGTLFLAVLSLILALIVVMI